MASKRKSRSLHVARGLDMPLDAVTQKISWLGRTGSGKSFGCKRMVEQMLRAGAQVVILDGSGGWAGLRLGPRAFKIPVLGGLYGDIPLEPTAGALIADVIVSRRASMVLDVSQMTDADRTRFATAFAQRFFQKQKASPSAVHLVLEECQDYVPENCQRGEERMLHEFQRLAKQGRPHGIGISFISQRPQEISKKALNQAECVFAFQMTGPHERKALKYWLTGKGFEEDLADVLPTLDIGTPYVWSPQWLKVSKIVHVLPIESQDTSRTPKVGERGKKPKRALKPIDLKALNSAMSETIERVKAEDPAELRKQLAERDRRIKELESAKPIPPSRAVPLKGVALSPFEVVVDRRHLEDTIEASERFEVEVTAFEKTIASSIRAFENLRRSANTTIKAVRRARDTGPAALSKRLAKVGSMPKEIDQVKKFVNTVQTAYVPKVQPASAGNSTGGGLRSDAPGDLTLGGNNGLRRILVALAQSGDGLERRNLALRAGLSMRASTFPGYLSKGRTAGWIDGRGRDTFRITEAGLAALGHYDPLPTGEALFEFWFNEVGRNSGAGRILVALRDAAPSTLSRDELATNSDLSTDASTFPGYLSRLRGLELIEGRGEGPFRISGELVG